MESLKIIQIISKIGKIISKIIYICCIVGICGAIIGIISLMVADEILISYGYNLKDLMKDNNVSLGNSYTALVVALIYCIGEIIISKYSTKYFENELDAGTPFTLSGSKELFNLGIIQIGVTIASLMLVSIAQSIMAKLLDDVTTIEFDLTIGLGITFIVISLICKYGSELNDKQIDKLD